MANFLSEMMEAGKQWDDILKELKEKRKKKSTYQLRILYPEKLSFKN